jgi:opacity protein-like surface antigen
MMRNRFAVALLGLVLVCGAGEMYAQDSWNYELSSTLWLSGVDGDVTVRGPDGPILLEFDELFGRVEPGYTASFQARRGKWGYVADGIHGRVAAGDADVALQFFTGGVTYELSNGDARVTLVVGGRYASARSGVRVEVEDPDEDADDDERFMKVGGSAGWVDAIVGLQVFRPFGPRWAFDGYVDAGKGQGDFSYQLAGGVTYQLSPALSAKGGYRIISADHDKNGFDFDAMFGGFYVGLGYQF